MAAKKALTAAARPGPKKGMKGTSASTKTKNGRPDNEKKEKPVSKSKLKRKEFQKKKYNKEKKEDDDSDFEIVPSSTTTSNTIELSDDESENEMDLEMDMFSSLKSKPQIQSTTPAKTAPAMKPITMDDSDNDDSEQEEKFIANENIAANRKNKKSGGFQSMGLSHPIFKAVLHKGFKVPTPIQRKCIPLVMQGNDVVGMARTGSGKTAAFLIPMLEKLKTHSAKVGARALILSPSRELAMQTQKVCKEMGKYTDLRSCSLVGGDNMDDQFNMLASNPDILIATPGRLLHLAVEMELDLRTVEYVVFDEADRLFEMGFAVQLHEILSRLPPNRQTLLFSATLPKMLVDFAKAGLQEPTLIRLDADTKISKDLEMAFFSVKEVEKEAALLYLLRHVIKLPKTTQNTDTPNDKKKKKKTMKRAATEADRQTILFAATKHHVEYLATLLSMVGYQVSYVYGSLDQTARIIQINRFRTGMTNLLVVTDVAARGIDIPILENVINYDFCASSKVFVHRVGRAARAGRRGWAYSLMTAEELPYLVDLELFLTRPLVVGSTKKELDYTSELVVGTLPKDGLGDDIAWLQQKIQDDASLEGLYKTAMNAYKLYNRTKPRAAPESYTRAKEVIKQPSWTALHPLLVNEDNSNEMEQQRLDLISKISGFRPNETIFEVGQRGTKKISDATVIMRQRRQTVGKIIHAHKSQILEQSQEAPAVIEAAPVTDLGGDVDESELANTFKIPAAKEKKSYRDEEFYLSYQQKDFNTERGYSMNTSGNFVEQAGKAQLDLIGDDNDTMRSTKNLLRWDSKKRKFVKGTGIGSDNKKMIRTESGALISASFKSGRFDEWAKKTRISMPRVGELELNSAKSMQQKRFRHNRVEEGKALDPLAIDYEKKMKKRKRDEDDTGKQDKNKKAALGQKRVGGKNVRSELKNAGQIRKQRIIKEKRREKTGRAPRKGKKGRF